MSWGERSCLKPCRIPEICNIGNCNVSCPEYIWDKITPPDSKLEEVFLALGVSKKEHTKAIKRKK